MWILCLSSLPPDSGTLISKGNAKCTFIREHNFGPLSSSPVLFVFSPGETLLTLSVVQEWLDTRNATAETHVLHTSVRSGSWSTDSSCSPLFVNLPHIFEWVLFHNPLQGAVIPIACTHFSGVPVAQWLEHCVSSAKVVGSIPREHMYWPNNFFLTWMHCKSLWIKASAKCINVNVNMTSTCILLLHILHCPLSGPDLIYIPLLIITCIIEYVTNKKKNLEPWVLWMTGVPVLRRSAELSGNFWGLPFQDDKKHILKHLFFSSMQWKPVLFKIFWIIM